jgi:endonuclease V-like protein UPF0215 family
MLILMKREIRIVGFDDGPFEFGDGSKGKTVPLIGAIYRGGRFIDGALRTDITVDGMDSTDKIVKLINRSRHKRQLRVIMFDGITVGGFNLIDIKKVHERTDLSVIAINRKMPDIASVKAALKKFKDFRKRWSVVQHAGNIKKCKLKKGKIIYYQNIGIDDEDAEDVIVLSCTHGAIPEPLRVAHLIATAVVKGESVGKA